MRQLHLHRGTGIYRLSCNIWCRAVRVPEECPQAISDLIDRCLEAEPDARPTAKEVFEVVKAAQTVQPPPLRSNSVSSSGALRSRISASLSQVLEDL